MTLAFMQADPAQEAAVHAVMRAAFAPYIRRLGREIAPTANLRASRTPGARRCVAGTGWRRAPGRCRAEAGRRCGRDRAPGCGAGSPECGHRQLLLRQVEQRARDGKAAALALYTAAMMDDLLRLYARHGFVEIRRGPPPHGKDALLRVFLRKDLR